LDAPIIGSEDTIKNKRASIVVGGNREVYKGMLPIFYILCNVCNIEKNVIDIFTRNDINDNNIFFFINIKSTLIIAVLLVMDKIPNYQIK